MIMICVAEMYLSSRFAFYLLLALYVYGSYGLQSTTTVNIFPTIPTADVIDLPGQCLTLTDYILNANDSGIFNTSNTTVVFLPGEHVIDGIRAKQLIVSSVDNIIWRGLSAKRAIITCKQEYALVFNEVIHLSIRDLEFRDCGTSTIRLKEIKKENAVAALLLENVLSVSIENIIITRSRGYGLLAVNMLGESVIDSSMFAQNNLKTEQNNTMGGNVLMIYINQPPYKKLRMAFLRISNSYFLNGSDNSLKNASSYMCSKDEFRANGLGLVMTQTEYKVTVVVEETIFSGNTRNMQHPAVRINMGETVNITITNSSFKHEGRFTIRLQQASQAFIKIENCSFSQGLDTGIDICTEESILRALHIIKIDNCLFDNFRSHAIHQSAVSVLQVQTSSCLRTRVQILRSIFQNNYIPSSRFLLSTYEPCSKYKITVVSCIFRNNYCNTPNSYIMFTERLVEQNAVWNYEKEWARGKRLDQVEFLNTSFISNRLNPSSYKGVVGLNRVFASFSDCQFINSAGTAIHTNESVISLFGKNSFKGNTGIEGGALSLIKSRLHLNENSTTVIKSNRADYGGGMFATPFFVKPTIGIPRSCALCTISLPIYDSSLKNLNISLEFHSNTAKYGNSIFYGAFSQCCVSPDCNHHKCIDNEFAFINTSLLANFSFKSGHDLSSIATKLLTRDSRNISTYPGAEFNISVRTSGEYRSIPPVVVTGRLCYDCHESSPDVCEHDYQSELHSGAGKQLVTQIYRNITYSIHSLQKKACLEIKVDQLLSEETPYITYYKRKDLRIMAEIKLLSCPLGYQMANKSNEKPYCECVAYLKRLGINNCDIKQGGKILRPKRMWIGFHHIRPFIIAAHKHCPFDYCVQSDSFFSLSSPDQQCNHNRAQVLCGACKTNLSLVLGTSNCKECSNTYLLLIIPFALAGVALVVLLLKCNLTVSVGHINGLIFYANIVHVNKALLFQNHQPAYRVFKVFIAWLNLDLGIETCFFKNMDTYSKVLFQFVFPVYLWIMIGLIVVLARYSSRAGRLIGSNSVPVLATLFILSYAKLLRTIIAAVSFTFIEFEDGSYITVWLHDANMKYLSLELRHSILFGVAIVFTLGFIFPVTLLVLLSPCLQSCSHRKAFKWVNRIKPFLDANQGPYNNHFRWWSGLLLILRIVLYSIFASNYDNDPSMSFFWINITVFPISIFCLIKPVHRDKVAKYFESLSLLNIVILCTTNWLTATTEYWKWQKVGDYASCVSVVLSMITFLIILLNQFSTRIGVKSFIKRKLRNQTANRELVNVQLPDKEMDVRAPTTSVATTEQDDRSIEPLLYTKK